MSEVKRYTAWAAEVALPRGTMVVLAADYDALAAELATERLRADAAVGDANAAERRVAELEGLLREVRHWFETQKKAISKGCGSSWDVGQCLEQINHIDDALAGQQQQGEPEWPKEQCPVTGAIRDVDPADLGDQQQGERCQGENCGTTTGQHSRECIEEAARDQGWIPTEEDFKGYAKAEQPATVDELRIVFDGPPSHESGRFVEVENAKGESINAGHWRQRDDGLWELVIVRSALAPAAVVVVMPERMTTIPEGKTISYAAGYEDALDAVASLNHTVSLELLERALSENDSICRTLALRELRAILQGGKT